MELDRDLAAVQQVRTLLRQAAQAQRVFGMFSQEDTDRVVAAMSEAAAAKARELAAMAVEETGFGRVEDKVVKNLFAAQAVFDSIRHTKTAGLLRADEERKVYEIAVPVGIVAGIIPSTNPTSTTIYKALIALKARNAIVFSPHPAARKCIARTAELLHQAAIGAGAPEGIIGCLGDPTMDATNELMRHDLTAVILATGGHGLVKAAYSSGKPAFGVGPGNVPAFIERTADVHAAVRCVVAGKCFDNGTICASEQAVVVDLPLDQAARRRFQELHAHFCNPDEKQRLESAMVTGGRINPGVVGRPAHKIAAMAGFTVPEETTALVAELTGVGPAEPLSMEKLSPVLAYYLVDGWRAGCEKCIEILNFGGLGHTMVIHSTDQEIIMKFALEKPAFRILVNTPGTHGAIGFSTGLTPALTLGCGTLGNNITTDNLTSRHLINIKRLAFGTKTVPFERGPAEASPESPPAAECGRCLEVPARESVRTLVEEVVRGMLAQVADPRTGSGAAAGPVRPPVAPATANQISAPARFISEADVREAMTEGRKITVSAATTITALARELGERSGILAWVDEESRK